MKGFINMFINFPDFDPDKIDAIMQIIKRDNQEIFQMACKSDYPIMIVPTQKEASRIEKIDFNAPFPRFVSRNAIDVSKADVLSGASVTEALVDKDFKKSAETEYLGIDQKDPEAAAISKKHDIDRQDMIDQMSKKENS